LAALRLMCNTAYFDALQVSGSVQRSLLFVGVI
jgi:hypothetical protein